MAGTWTADKLPQFEPAIRQLTEQHRELEDEPLHLALAYLPIRDRKKLEEIFLFEVIGIAADLSGDAGEVLEATFEPVPGLPTGFSQALHLILTTPRGIEKALRNGDALALKVADAVQRGDFKVLHTDSIGSSVLKQLSPASAPR